MLVKVMLRVSNKLNVKEVEERLKKIEDELVQVEEVSQTDMFWK